MIFHVGNFPKILLHPQVFDGSAVNVDDIFTALDDDIGVVVRQTAKMAVLSSQEEHLVDDDDTVHAYFVNLLGYWGGGVGRDGYTRKSKEIEEGGEGKRELTTVILYWYIFFSSEREKSCSLQFLWRVPYASTSY